jgi:hypothetical protein
MDRLGRRTSRVTCLLIAAVATVAAVAVTVEAPAAAAPPVGTPALSGGVNGQVYATVVVGDTVFVGGSFSRAQTRAGASAERTNLAAFRLGSGALIGSWRADVDGVVRSLASAGGYLYVGGDYTRVGGVAQARLARVSVATGAVDQGFRPQLNAGVRAVEVRGGAVFAGGQFTVAGGSPQSHLAKFVATSGAKVTSFAATANGPVNAVELSPDGTRLAVGGSFSTLSGAGRTGLGLVDPSSGSVVGPGFAGSVNPMLTVSWSGDGSALFGGSDSHDNLAARWNPGTGARGWHFTVGGDVQAVDYYDGTVYVGFHDNYQGDTRTKLLAVDAASGAISSSFRPTFNQFWGVRSISAGPWGLAIGGQFTTVSGVWAHNWAIWPTARLAPRLSVASPERSTYGMKVRITVTVLDGTGTVTLTGAGPTVVETLAQGSATFAPPRTLAAGKHTLTVAYSGDDRHAPGRTTRALSVTKAGTTVRAIVTRKATTRRAGRVKVTVASVVSGGDAPGGDVKLTLRHGSRHRSAGPLALHGATVTFTLPRLGAGSWHLVARYTGDSDHRAASAHRTLKVAKGR